MHIFESDIPNLRIVTVGTGRNSMRFIETTVDLKAWDGYLSERRKNGKSTSGKTTALNFGGYNGDKSIDWQPEINAYHYLLRNQYAIKDSILNALAEKFDWLKETYYLDPEDDPDVPNVTPETKAGFDFRPFIGTPSISFIDESKDNTAYLEWHFLCAWDPEHGLAAITHENRVIDLDRGETDIWKIYADNGTLAEKQKEYEESMKNLQPKIQNPWWKFW